MVVTANFLDSDWKLHKRIINFCSITSHKGEDIGRVLEQCLREWDINKVFTITVDNVSANDLAVVYMKKRLRNMNTLSFDGDFLHLRCACHIINLIVKDEIKELENGIDAIWHCVKWNNTYLMLEAALKYEKVFHRMADEDLQFKRYFEEKDVKGRKRVGPPLEEDWRNAKAFVHFLKKIYESTLKLSAWKSVTADLQFIEMIGLQKEIDKKAKDDSDEVLHRVIVGMKAKFDKYWGRFETMNKSCNGRLGVEFDDLEDGQVEILADLMQERLENEHEMISNEVDKYLVDRYINPVVKGFDIAQWWRENAAAYPILSKLAQDIFAIPCSTMASENAFSLGKRVVDPFRSSLNPQMVEALAYTSDWLRVKQPNFYSEPTKDKLSLYSDLEELQKETARLHFGGANSFYNNCFLKIWMLQSANISLKI
ncbi:zinc finger BED domain-containing protein RICESLEEPER 1-like [Rosa chinensis]|uniref:zinc finger BED domain-containing protein RICESLEEPER 1-like n=1 Tax=Rosa chinensis TaxID=74649 RepID=UPI000D08A883|nr:zinc finger BED domain-containing protein RICESLEEPER 1-like [Rosa chinensis]